MKNFKPTFYKNVDDIAGEHDFFKISIDYNGNLVLLTEKEEKGKYLYKIFHFISGETRIIQIPSVSYSFEFAQPIEENWLLVSSRIDDDEGPINNATIYDVQGNALDTFSFGDAIEDVQTTKNSEIWVSYFDENMDYGLRCFNIQGLETFNYIDFVKKSNNEIPYIADCYALNVTSDETVFIYYYNEFPLVKIEKDTYEIFKNIPIQGSHAFAIKNDFALFSHDYGSKGEVYLYSLHNRSKKKIYTMDQEGKSLNYKHAVGRDNKLFLTKDKVIYLIELENILSEI
ncbi:hypothetical protein [Bacillus sp. AFS088145]|uniref:hypothetical protein n=1 Tax=Bacillus sp. AFS088145 TaxID=2033514 RepID=UPI000BF41685|nr:hypothetical protein [Bacillus sp. AFS088145]PFH88689.1 hypothetical protein COI44_08015 [Bacillus sp. AFS088145]